MPTVTPIKTGRYNNRYGYGSIPGGGHPDPVQDYASGETGYNAHRPSPEIFQRSPADTDEQIKPTGIYQVHDPNKGALKDLQSGEYATSSAVRKLGSPQTWLDDPNLANLSNLIPQLMGYNGQTGQYDPGRGLNVFSPSMMGTIRAQGQQALNQAGEAERAGYVNSQSGRGTAGINPFAILGSNQRAQDRGQLAQGSLQAHLAGIGIGQQLFPQVGQLADAEQARYLDTQKLDFANRNSDKTFWQNELTNRENAVNDFMRQYGIQLTSKGGGKHEADILKNLRAQLDDLQHEQGIAQANLSRYA